MRSHKDLQVLLESIDGKSYPHYKKISGEWDFGQFSLRVDHVQGDAYATPSKMRLFIRHTEIQTPSDGLSTNERKVALRDYLTRRFHQASRRYSRLMGTGKGGIIEIDAPGQQILDKTSCLIHEEDLEIRFEIGLPADGRNIRGNDAATILCDSLPKVVKESIYFQNIPSDDMIVHVLTYEDAEYLRGQLQSHDLVAFIANDSNLARQSGISDYPLTKGIPFCSPSNLEVELNRPNHGPIKGMGIRKGISVIIGGGYHGKSTLLRAIEKGVYNHIPGDGREWVITDASACKIRAEDGRSISQVRISPFINNLPGGRSTDAFTTDNASGSTSQAANIMESIESGSKVLLLDEDTSATNFMIRDRRMQEIIAKEHEPITPFVDRIRQFYDELNISVILVMGGSGDYFEAADQVIAMNEYQPQDRSEEAKSIAIKFNTGRQKEGTGPLNPNQTRIPLPGSLSGSKGRHEINIRCRKTDELTYGYETINTFYIEQIVHESQLRAIGYGLHHIQQKIKNKASISELLEELYQDMKTKGLASLCKDPDGKLALFRPHELAATLNRCRTLKIQSS